MCGLISVIAKNKTGFFKPQADVFSQLLFVDTLRGPHSTGVFGVHRDGNATVIKDAIPGTSFVQHPRFLAFQQQMPKDIEAVVGHNRWATKGEVNEVNAHPFYHGNIVLVHNGTLWGHRAMANVEVDSEAVCISIAERGIDDTVRDLDGAYALIWYDANVDTGNRTLNFIRNKERPLHMFETYNSYVLCSEEEMGQMVLSRTNQKIEEEKAIPEDTLFTFDLVEKKMTTRELKQKKKVYQTYTYIPPVVQNTTKPISNGLEKTGTIELEPWTESEIAVDHGRQAFENLKYACECGHFMQSWMGKYVTFRAEDFTMYGNLVTDLRAEFFSQITDNHLLSVMVHGVDEIDQATECGELYVKLKKYEVVAGDTMIDAELVSISYVNQISKNNLIIDEDLWGAIKNTKCVSCKGPIRFNTISDTHVNVKWNNKQGTIRKMRCTCHYCVGKNSK